MRSVRLFTTLGVGIWLALFLFAAPAAAQPTKELPDASWSNLPRWRGFNLLEKFNKDIEQPFREDDFRLIAKLGFNFVRLPMDYRCWIKNGDWNQIDDQKLDQIAEAVKLGEKYGIHVCLNFHRAPGYTVAQPPEAKKLWSDAEAQRVCAKHWGEFAKRFKGTPSKQLSFNLFNEPTGVDAQTYATVVKQMVDAIRAHDPERLVICDGLEWGRAPVPELKALKVAQATRGYTPFDVTHYKANWVEGSEQLSPSWPRKLPVNGILLEQNRKQSAPLIIEGNFAEETTLRVRVHVVSTNAHLVVEADGKNVYERDFVSGPGQGEWKEVHYNAEWKIYQNVFDRDYTTRIPAGTRRLRIYTSRGDWLQLGEIGLQAKHPRQRGGERAEDVLKLSSDWGQPIPTVTYNPHAPDGPFVGLPTQGREWLQASTVQPWLDAKNRGIGVMVGEWGAYNRTPHDVVLRWSEDCLANWKEADVGWALWNFRGSFGVLDSERPDVKYETWEGHQLDRRLLELLQRY